ncbi:hypothetical protein Despr_1715 [Desulfobulbus propionicus DSM 2032]|jgi:hypothetical protein|uniref:Uncharacterized protein n=1 Tax=Desulfobulbus propionicus (strain ATCC 33891 / DSM 2032 / VKM B-1956 / 1pr3) TaxID=577650 RepID=A0A7U3YLZ8_DESPD|nr:hypothetical protein [Desulfobulbus propionicus]ADW17867.1 hypothetical protein Despr_1715 [Desulfobulbus propionicus DSM 2032]
MHHVFLYTPRDSATFRQVETYFRQFSWSGALSTLPPGSGFSSPLCLQMRSNDILLLFAHDDDDIDALLLMGDEFKSYRIILVISSEQQVRNNRYSHLSPRFVGYLESNIDEVVEYLTNIFRKETHNTPFLKR